MATGVQLSRLVKDLRAECGHSLAIAQGQGSEETLRYLIARQQEELYVGYEWPFLRVERSLRPAAGQRYYAYPPDMPFDRVTAMWVHDVGSPNWTEVTKGIDPTLFSLIDSETGIRGWPVRRWDHNADTNQIELWPIPSQDTGEIRMSGMKPLLPLISSNDVCTLDGTLIVLFCAVEILAKTAPQESQIKSQKAQRHLQRLLAAQGSRKRSWTVTSGRRTMAPVVGLDFIPRGFRN